MEIDMNFHEAKAFLLTSIAILGFSPAIGSTSFVDSQESKHAVKLEGMRYPEARKIIIGYGWNPVAGACEGAGADQATCNKYPEINNCSGNGGGFCDMSFSKARRCLVVITYGGAPYNARGGDTRVRDVIFSNRECSKP